MIVIKLNTLERLEEFQKDYNFLVIQFSASWCNPCRKITPEMIKWASRQKTKDVVYLYCDINKEAGNKLVNVLDIEKIPSFLVVCNKTNTYSDMFYSNKKSEIVKFITKNVVF